MDAPFSELCIPGLSPRRMLEAIAPRHALSARVPALSMAKARYVHPALRFVLGDLLRIPYHEATFGMAMCSETIEHTTEYRRALAELHRVLRPGGVLVVTTPNRLVTTPAARRLTDPIPYPYHTQEFTAGEMTAFLREAGFGEVSVYGNRQQVLFPTRLLRHLYKRLRDPNHRQSPAYEPKKRFRQPRNLLFVARKEP